MTRARLASPYASLLRGPTHSQPRLYSAGAAGDAGPHADKHQERYPHMSPNCFFVFDFEPTFQSFAAIKDARADNRRPFFSSFSSSSSFFPSLPRHDSLTCSSKCYRFSGHHKLQKPPKNFRSLSDNTVFFVTVMCTQANVILPADTSGGSKAATEALQPAHRRRARWCGDHSQSSKWIPLLARW